MREGMNPNRRKYVKPYSKVIVSVTTHLPNQRGYHEERFDVVRASLETMRANAGMDCEIWVWDNGSCANLKGWLINDYKPDYLTFSRNVGKSIARATMVRGLPKGTIIGCADDDMFYYPDWLKKQVEILETYPNVGTVSGWPVRTQFRFHNKATVEWGEKNGCTRYGRFISDEEERDFCTSIGRDYEGFHVNYTKDDTDVLLDYSGIKAYATGHHCQFIGYADVVGNFVEYNTQATADERPFEQAIDQAGLLRLTTFERTTRHIGNILDPKLEVLWHEYVT
jgi:hypothetical protein